MTQDKGLRFNEGKLRYDLEPVFARRQYISVLTKGARKYADRNWEQGMRWSKVIASAERHLAALKSGEDYDFDPNCEGCQRGDCTNHTGELHSALLMCNAAFITEYYKIYPEGDDRANYGLRTKKIGLDIDEVLCDWVSGWQRKFGDANITGEVNHWAFSYDVPAQYKSMTPEEMSEFYLSLDPLIDPKDMPFEPHCYITSRSVPVELTMHWLQAHGFPTAKVISLGHGESKVQAALESGLEWFVDDRFDNFLELTKAGVCCFLMDAPHNRKYNVGHKRIKSLKELVEY